MTPPNVLPGQEGMMGQDGSMYAHGHMHGSPNSPPMLSPNPHGPPHSQSLVAH